MKEIRFEGQVHRFPDDVTDDEINQALGGPQIRAPQSFTERVESRRARGSVMPFVSEAVDVAGKTIAPYVPLPAVAQQGIQESDVGRAVVPQTPLQVGATIGTLGAGPAFRTAQAGFQSAGRAAPWLSRLPAPLQRILGGAIGGETGGQVEEAPTGLGAAVGAGGGVLAEIVGAGGGKLVRSAPYMKARINEGQAADLASAMESINPAAGGVIRGQQVSPMLRGGTTAARLKQGVESGEMQTAASTRFGDHLAQVDQMTGHPAVYTNAFVEAYSAMPQIARDRLVGPVGPQGFTLEQAHAVRSWVGSSAFSQSPLGQGVGPVPQQKLWGELSQDLDAVVAQGGPRAMDLWRTMTREYGGLTAVSEGLTQGNAFQGLPNRIFLNRSALSDYLAKNQMDITARGGPQAYRDLVNQLLQGGQQGTRDLLTPGAGEPTSALMQVYGRGQGGAPAIPGSALRTLLSNVGSQYTGRAPYSLPPQLQAILDIMMQKGAAETADRMSR